MTELAKSSSQRPCTNPVISFFIQFRLIMDFKTNNTQWNCLRVIQVYRIEKYKEIQVKDR